MAFDLERAEVVLFGGGALGSQFSDTWVYNGATWTQRTPVVSPPGRWESAVVFDPLCGRIVLQGGTTFSYQTIFADSWLWDGSTWTQISGVQPSARHGAMTTFDVNNSRSLCFGGRDAAGFRSDLWAWDGGCHRTMSTLSPAVAGLTAQYRYAYPVNAVGNVYLEFWTLRNPNAFPLPIPGFVSLGLTRIDVFFILRQSAGILNQSGVVNTAPLAIPNTNAVVGFTFDVQDVDLDLPSNHLFWAENDIEATVAPGVPVASFTAAPVSGVVPFAVQFTDSSLFATGWQWDFQNDGVVDSTAQTPTFTYQAPGSYDVRLTVTGPAGSNTTWQYGMITAYQAPDFVASPTIAPAPTAVQFTDTTPFSVTSWQWDFQDDGIVDSTLQNPTFAYTMSGAYAVRLTVTTTSAPTTRTTRRGNFVLIGFSPDAQLNMVPVAPGTFQMGSNAVGGYSSPIHAVTITRPFWIGRYEVTQAGFQAVTGVNPSYFQGVPWPNAPMRPVEQVTWSGAMSYCQQLTQIEQAAGRVPPGYQYRLPTEGEWEYCCRAGTSTTFSFGNTLSCLQANFHDFTFCWMNGQTSVVGNYAPNALGLRDMHGNVFEWCLDGWDSTANYPASATFDPYVASGPLRVLRGGAWYEYVFAATSAYRSGVPLQMTRFDYGFRVVCAPILP